MSKKSINIKMGVDLRKFSSGLKNAQRDLKRFGRKATDVGRKFKGISIAIGIAGAASVKLAMDFEQAMAKVRAISGATNEQFKALEKNALKLGRTTRYTASQVAELQLNLSKLGLNPKQITDSTQAILNLSLATGEDLAQSATVAASTMRGFGLEAADMERIADVMAKSFSSSALDLEKFSTAMAVVAPVAKLAGQDLEGTTAILGALVNRGMDASTAGTSLRNIFLTLAEKGLTWNEAMSKIVNSTDQLSVANELFGKRGATAATIVANNSQEILGLDKTMRTAAGSAKEMAGIMDDTLNGAMLSLRSALEGVAIEIGTMLTPLVKKLSQFIKALADRFQSLSDGSKKLIIIITGMVGAIGPLLLLVGAIATALAGLTAAMATVVLTATAVVGAIALLSLVISGMIKEFKRANDPLRGYTKTQKILLDQSGKIRQTVAKESVEFRTLASRIKHANTTGENRKALIKQLNTQYGTTIGNYESELDLYRQLENAQNKYLENLKKKITLQMREEQLTKLLKRQIELQDELADKQEEVAKIKHRMLTTGDDQEASILEERLKGMEVGISLIKTEAEQAEQAVDKFVVALGEIDSSKVDGAGGGGGGGDGGDDKELVALLPDMEPLAHSQEAEIDRMIAKHKELMESMGKVELKTKSSLERMEEAWERIGEAIKNMAVDVIGDSLMELGNKMANAGQGTEAFGTKMLIRIAEFVGQLGKLLMAAAIASDTFQKTLLKHPAVAFAAGAAAVFLAGAVKGHLEKGLNEGGGSSMPSGFSGGSSSGGYGMSQSGGFQYAESELYGDDIYLVSDRAGRRLQRRR